MLLTFNRHETSCGKDAQHRLLFGCSDQDGQSRRVLRKPHGEESQGQLTGKDGLVVARRQASWTVMHTRQMTGTYDGNASHEEHF